MSTLVERLKDEAKEEVRMEAIAKQMHERMAPPGSFNLPPLLEERRWRYGIPDNAFRVQASFERLLVWPIEPIEMASISSGAGIVIPDQVRERMKSGSPRGVIVSAGLKALDALRTNGMDIGHVVLYTHYVIGTYPVMYADGKELKLLIMTAGDITGSEDTMEAIKAGKMEIRWNPATNEHGYAAPGADHLLSPVIPHLKESI